MKHFFTVHRWMDVIKNIIINNNRDKLCLYLLKLNIKYTEEHATQKCNGHCIY